MNKLLGKFENDYFKYLMEEKVIISYIFNRRNLLMAFSTCVFLLYSKENESIINTSKKLLKIRY